MSDGVRAGLLVASEIAKIAIPKLSSSQIGEVALVLIRAGHRWFEVRQQLADNNATPEQLQYLDEQNEIDVFDKINSNRKDSAAPTI